MYSFEKTLHPAIFRERPNRFIGLVEVNGQLEKAHIADPGRLKELLVSGARGLVQDHGDKPGRKLRYSLDFIYSAEGHLVSLNTQLPNRIMAHFLAMGNLPGFEGYRIQRPEFRFGKSRFDFLLNTPAGQPALLEVKSVTLVEERQGKRVALFPDAPTARGTRHIQELMLAQADGYEARLVFVIQRHDAQCFMPNRRTDLALAEAVEAAILNGVMVQAFTFEMRPGGCHFIQEVPVFV